MHFHFHCTCVPHKHDQLAPLMNHALYLFSVELSVFGDMVLSAIWSFLTFGDMVPSAIWSFLTFGDMVFGENVFGEKVFGDMIRSHWGRGHSRKLLCVVSR